jgi:hypothetical protein
LEQDAKENGERLRTAFVLAGAINQLGVDFGFEALLNFEWVKSVGIDGGKVEFAGDEEEHCFHGLKASVSARLSFGSLE